MEDCHPGSCKGGEKCNKKVRLWCKCKRVKKDFLCLYLQKKQINVECDDVCESLRNERKEAQEAMMAKKREMEELRNREEIEKFEKKFKPRRKRKDKHDNLKESQENKEEKWNIWILAISISIIGITIMYIATSKLNVFGMS